MGKVIERRNGKDRIHIVSLNITVGEHNINVRIPKHNRIDFEGRENGPCDSRRGAAGQTHDPVQGFIVFGVKCNDCQKVFS